jgi:hypothetical protein
MITMSSVLSVLLQHVRLSGNPSISNGLVVHADTIEYCMQKIKLSPILSYLKRTVPIGNSVASGKGLSHRSAITSDQARLDIRARGFGSTAQDVLF